MYINKKNVVYSQMKAWMISMEIIYIYIQFVCLVFQS